MSKVSSYRVQRVKYSRRIWRCEGLSKDDNSKQLAIDNDVGKLLERGWLSKQSSELRSAILTNVEFRSFAHEAPIFHVEDPSPMLCGIAEGSVMMACPHPIYGLLNVHLKNEGGWFGIAGLHFSVNRIFSAFSRGPTRLAILRRPAYLQIRDTSAEFAKAFDNLQLSEFHLILRSGLDLLVRDNRARLISRLITISEVGLTAPASMPIQLPLTHDELARMCNLSRKTVQAYLDDLEKQGLCKVGYRSLEITDPPALLELINTLAEAD